MIFGCVPVGPFQCNCWIVACPKTGEAICIDPGDESPKILKLLSDLSAKSSVPLKLKYLLHTHAHLDHVGATRSVKESFKGAHRDPSVEVPPILLHKADEPIYLNLKQQGLMFGLQLDDPLPIDQYIVDEQQLSVGDLKFSVLHTPGHSPGSVCFRLHEERSLQAPEILFSGDTLFQGSVGRTDLWGGDQDALFRNIKSRLFTLDGDTRLCPGHGDESTVGIEKRENPFF